MTSFLSQATMRTAVDRLGVSRAQSALVDYLIFKRAIIIAGGDPATASVVTGTKSDSYVQAVDELAKVAEGIDSERRYFSPFGSRRDAGRGFKSKKFPSNGPSDTASRWQSKPTRPIEELPNTKPKEFRPVDRNVDELARFFLVAGGSATATEKPRLIDLATWFHRDTDLDSLQHGGANLAETLLQRTRSALGLTDVEIEALFVDDPAFDAELATDETVAAPASYLPVPPVQSKKTATPTAAIVTDGGEADVGDPAEPHPSVVDQVVAFVAARGFVFDPWQIAAYITAVRTKPFVILAGISGTGKTKLPRLIAEATGAEFKRIAVRPDWTDSSELLGYERLGTGPTFVPGHLLLAAREAQENPAKQYFVLLDEMNVARVEYYLAEVLSHLEERSAQGDGTIASDPLVPNASEGKWASVRLPGNLTIVGSVNMDETTFGFSRKVLDRSFVIEFSTVSLSSVNPPGQRIEATRWPVERWSQAALSLAEHPNRDHEDVGRVITALETINQGLTPLQMQVGYRVRDEIAMFVLRAHDCPDSFVAGDEALINPLDLAIAMKVLPRIQGTGPALRAGLEQLIAWADPQDATASTTGIETESFPFCADRLRMMLQRLDETGFSSFWL